MAWKSVYKESKKHPNFLHSFSFGKKRNSLISVSFISNVYYTFIQNNISFITKLLQIITDGAKLTHKNLPMYTY